MRLTLIVTAMAGAAAAMAAAGAAVERSASRQLPGTWRPPRKGR